MEQKERTAGREVHTTNYQMQHGSCSIFKEEYYYGSTAQYYSNER